ncbi:replicative DNA helicase [Ectothiorhodospiraceae bacterium BW-2]|nr:replicative DNA helicase [Ectothiorhodospiraceae bacterium BW-2]
MVDYQTEALKTPPHSAEAEQSLLGGLLLDNQSWDRVADLVGGEDFYRYDHRLIFAAIEGLARTNQPFDAITISEYLQKRQQLDDIGGVSYLSNLVSSTPSVTNIVAYANIVRERSVKRQLIRVANEIADSVFTNVDGSVETILDDAERRVFEIAEQTTKNRSSFQPMKKLLAGALERIEELYASSENITGIATGFDDFDGQTSGLQPADLVIIAGRPSMGKTSFAMNIAENAAIKGKKPVAIFSLEMPGEQIVMRMIASLGRINLKNLRTGALSDEDWPRITSAIAMLNEAPIFIDDTSGLSPTELRAKARRLSREHGLGLIVIDYLQLMQGSDNRQENRATELSEISRSLKNLAKELGVPVIALSQLNRSLENRPNKRPIMSDLRESGAIEQDADLIAFVYRDEVYNEDTKESGVAEIIIGKQRNGPIGTVRLSFLHEHTRFENLTTKSYDDYYHE